MHKVRTALSLSAVAIGAALAIACGGGATEPTPDLTVSVGPSTTRPTPGTRPATSSALTAEQRNASRAAAQYLDGQSFSRKGLIKQLEFEGYSTKAATVAVDSLHANWNDQAAKSAANYLDGQAFSRKSLISQLEFEGFTHDQATYGAKQAGL
jgi:hypothetical protein